MIPASGSVGARAILRSEDGLILGIKSLFGGYDRPGGGAVADENPKEAAARHLSMLCGIEALELFPAHRGRGDLWEWTSSYEVRAHDGEFRESEDVEMAWVGMQEIMCGPSGLFARDAFNKLGWMNRPALSLDRLYRLSKISLNDRAGRIGAESEGIDAVIDEITLLVDLGKKERITEILAEADCSRLHANILDTFVSMLEEMPDLPGGKDFVAKAKGRIEEVDGRRTKIRFMGHDDVRAAALKIYRQRAKDFGDMLRKGTLKEWMEKRRETVMREVAENRRRAALRAQEETGPDESEGPETRGHSSVGKLRYS